MEEEEKKEELITIDPTPLLKLKPMKPLMVLEFKKFEGVAEVEERNDAEYRFNRFNREEQDEEHEQIKIPKCNWAYKTEPTTRLGPDEDETDFLFIVPYCYAVEASEQSLKKGLLESVEVREDD